jgi:polynucleotide 5'-kinase involved in rRNA processing
VRQKEESSAKEKEVSSSLHAALKYVLNSTVTDGLRVIQGGSNQPGIISFSGHSGDWFQPRNAEDHVFALGREVPQDAPAPSSSLESSHKIVSIDLLLDKAEKTMRRNGSVIVYGGRGAGKTAALNAISSRMYGRLFRISSLF